MDLKTLREEFETLKKASFDVITAAATAKKDLTGEEKAANDQRFSRMDQIHSQIQEFNKFAKLAMENGNVVLPTEPPGRKEHEESENRQAKQFMDASGNLNIKAIRDGINHFARTGDARQLFTVTSGTNSGAYLPKEVLQPVSVRRLQNCFRGVLASQGLEPMEIGTVSSFSIPVADDTANTGQAVSESATSGTSLDPTQSGISIAPTLWDSKALWYSNTIVMANTFDVVGFSLPVLQKRIQKIQESTWTTAVLSTGTVGKTTASPTAVTYAELVAWEHSLAPAYRSDAAFILSDSLYQALRGLVDSNNRPIMDLDPTNVFAAKLHGRPVIIGEFFQTLAANHTVGAFVSADALKIVDVMDARLARYANIPSQPDQVGFQLFQNGDFGFVSNGLSLLKSAIS